MTTKKSAANPDEVQVKVTFARPWTTADGKTYKPDQTTELGVGEADEMLRLGYARPADDEKGN